MPENTMDDQTMLKYGKKSMIVLVDDEVSILNTTKSLLRRTYNVQTFTNPLEVEAFLDANDVDIVISDEMMPEMRGSELVERIHLKHPDIVKIILSGQAEKDNIIAAVNRGHIFSFLYKPTDNAQMMQVIEKGLENKRMKEEIKEKNAELERHNLELEVLVNNRTRQVLEMEKFFEVGKFASSIVHNLNNPLQTLIMASQLLEYEVSDLANSKPSLNKYLNMINGSMENMEKMIKSITASVRTGQYEKNVPVDINKVIESSIEYLKINSDFKHNVDVVLTLDPNLPQIVAQEIHFTQIFANLLKNAVDAMEGCKEKIIQITTIHQDGKLDIKITDSGSGISKENLPKIFSTDFTTKPPGKGTGLGLPITKQMVEAYKGSLLVNSEVGVGTTFEIILPVQLNSN